MKAVRRRRRGAGVMDHSSVPAGLNGFNHQALRPEKPGAAAAGTPARASRLRSRSGLTWTRSCHQTSYEGLQGGNKKTNPQKKKQPQRAKHRSLSSGLILGLARVHPVGQSLGSHRSSALLSVDETQLLTRFANLSEF